MENNINRAVVPAVLVALLTMVEIILIPGTVLKIIMFIFTQLLGTGLLFFMNKDFSDHFSYLLITYTGFGLLTFLTSMGWLTISIDSKALFAAHIIAFFVPVVFCSVAAFIMRETQRNYFGEFFIGQAIVLAISFVLFYIYWFSRFNLDRTLTERTIRLVPFATLASILEKLIYGTITPGDFVRYLCYCIVIYIPFGFLLGGLGEKLHLVTEVLLALAFPLIMELLQYAFMLNACDIDDILFGFLGSLLGIVCFNLLNLLSRYRTGATLFGDSRRLD